MDDDDKEELGSALRDALLTGTGYLLILPGGFKRLEPTEVLLPPPEDEKTPDPE